MDDVFNIDEWAERSRIFWEDFEKNGLKLPVIDSLVRHKWPEDKPYKSKEYLVDAKNSKDKVKFYSVELDEWGTKDGDIIITSGFSPNYWWEFPKVVKEDE